MDYVSPLDEYPYPVLAERARQQDILTKRSNTGIHKDDFALGIRGMPAREFGSQGQIKSLIFALHLSKYALLRERSGLLPILLLDDIFDKLDERRLRRLMEILTAEDFGQVFISDTSEERVTALLRDFPVRHLPMPDGSARS
jgi:DNA replication and repair protein RecF